MTTEFVLIRHGETDWNVEGRYQGTSDTLLNQHGMKQAEAVANAMRGEEWDIIASSPLKRTWNTALRIADAIGIPEDEVIPDEQLIERHYGVAEGFTPAEREQTFPDGVWDGLESRDDLRVRTMATMDIYLARFPNKRIVLVTHGTWINSVLYVLTQGRLGHGKSVILNGSRTYISHDGDGWHVDDISLALHFTTPA